MPTDPSTRYGGYTFDELAPAFMQVESSGGTNVTPRYEPKFEAKYGRKWVTDDPQFRATVLKRLGNTKTFSSYGPFQVMYPVAVELGFRGTPEELAEPTTNRQYFEKKFLRDWRGTKGNFDATISRYNGRNNPEYVAKVRHYLPQLKDTMDRQALADGLTQTRSSKR